MTKQEIYFEGGQLTPEEFIEKIKTDPQWEHLFLKGVIAAILPIPFVQSMHDAGILDFNTFMRQREFFVIHYFDFKVLKPYDLETFEKMREYFELVQNCTDKMKAFDEKSQGQGDS